MPVCSLEVFSYESGLETLESEFLSQESGIHFCQTGSIRSQLNDVSNGSCCFVDCWEFHMTTDKSKQLLKNCSKQKAVTQSLTTECRSSKPYFSTFLGLIFRTDL